MTSIGETLRRERIRQGLELQKVSESTKIGTRMLQAMEQDDLSKLPGGVFTRSFIKQYAVALGLDLASLDEQLKSLPTGVEESARADARKDVIPEHSHYSLSDYNSSRNNGSLFMSAIWVVVAMAAVGGIYYLVNRPPSAVALPETVKTATPPQATTEPAPAAPVETPAPAAAPASGVEVNLSAIEDVWVSITADGKYVYSGDMNEAQKRTIQAQQKIRLVVGNAGGLQIQLNGKPVDAIGPKGQVRVVEFTPEGAHVIPRALPKSAPLP